ncbi:MAG: low molecular weight protein arginine phosphatase [Eubacteriales bacterium]|nr:low molecular weight protein arginine phosphatase [Eubacteriales bacterium]
MNEIIFICTGNTCRSPMAEGLFRSHGGEEKTGLTAVSAGLFTQDGLPASQNAQTAAKELGADLSRHRSRLLTPEMARGAKYLVCMTGAHYDTLCERFPDCRDKIFTLLPTDISDPFGGDLETYRRAAAEIDRAAKSVITQLGGPDGELGK